MGGLDIDDLIVDQEEHEGKTSGSGQSTGKKKVLVGTVERFFEKISVAAITLSRDLKVGDTIELETGDGTFTVKVSSMQINKQEVTSALEGDSVGIKVPKYVVTGSKVYMSA